MSKGEIQTGGPELEEITLWKNPILTVSTFILCCLEWAGQAWTIIRQRIVMIVLLIAVIVVPHVVHGPHTPVLSI